MKYNSSKRSLLEYAAKVRQEDIISNSTINRNNLDFLNTNLDSKDFYFKQDLLYTNKLSEKNVLQISAKHSTNSIPQRYIITPPIFNNQSTNNIQDSEFRKNNIEMQSVLLGKINEDKYNIVFGADLNFNPFTSNLSNDPVIINNNNLEYSKKTVFNNFSYTLNFGSLKITPSYRLTYLDQRLENKTEISIKSSYNWLFEPLMNIVYKTSSSSYLAANIEINRNDNIENHLFTNEIISNNRIIRKNKPSLELPKNQVYSLYYNNVDLNKRMQINFGLTYKRSKGSFFNNFLIDENLTQIEYFFLPEVNNLWTSNIQMSKYLSFIDSTIRLRVNYSFYEYNNIINNSELRENRSNSNSYELSWKTAFNIPLNIENNLFWAYSRSQSDGNIDNVYRRLNNNLKLLFKPNNRWNLVLDTNYYLPNLENNTQLILMDFNLDFTPKSTIWSAGLVVKNILNESKFEQAYNNDFGNFTNSYNLLKRHFYFRLNCSL